MKDTDDSSAQPKCETDTGDSLNHKNDTENKIDGNNAKKANSLKSGSVPLGKKSVNSKATTVQVKAHLTKVHVFFFIYLCCFLELNLLI